MNISYHQAPDYVPHLQPDLYPDLYYRDPNLKQQTLTAIDPVVRHGLREAQHLGYRHALREAVAIGYLMGRGYQYHTAWKTVESWWRPPGTPLPQHPY
ncbi:hypothetical protein [Bacillus glycinifermentans]|uniref:Uncharacterized protein n=1 Tax=Bacillus glycinifermentans TaxID=1664069 RepID=A0ABU6H1I8_9BACI|nr:hypothetical protein [Bacillus glycinifermentans]MEC0484524.1 hypothetical protein [Bacillus glycinifermentans]MEC0496915.1 hypothetical protein [Bacillus glycinifermentans]MEC0539580.1 hypothetical protein [Bacillus glycinifermentans]MEC3608517.1 hypothetical protein [Bacillus glycinifermentans]UOY87674.1 hypothetical protein MW696_16590 [Bacillus glycinifermentans]